jgi:hypothetical protein
MLTYESIAKECSLSHDVGMGTVVDSCFAEKYSRALRSRQHLFELSCESKDLWSLIATGKDSKT